MRNGSGQDDQAGQERSLINTQSALPPRVAAPIGPTPRYQKPEGIKALPSQSKLFQSVWGENNSKEVGLRHTAQSAGFAPGRSVRTTEDQATGERLIARQDYNWASPALYHHPLIFEQVNLERYGLGPHAVLQPATSAAHFFGNIALLPYHTVATPPKEKVYIFGHRRPGNCVPYQHHHIRRSWKGLAAQGLVTGGLGWVFF